jgi:hypothetical protein
MPGVLFAVRDVWIAIATLVIGTTVSWLLYHLVVDFAKWFKEEILDDIRDHRKKLQEKRQAMIRSQEDG